jgi:hypothetical protein
MQLERLYALGDPASWRRLVNRRLGKVSAMRPRRHSPGRFPTAARLQRLASAVDAHTYLEIGLHAGLTFERVAVDHKWGVDPNPRFSWSRVPENWHIAPKTSDAFFAGTDLPVFDLVFIDGWHEYHQVLRDLKNALNFLTPSGLVLVDDVLPASALSAARHSQEDSETDSIPAGWAGDVFRVVYLLSLLDPERATYCTVSEPGHVQTLVVSGARQLDFDSRVEDAEQLCWDEGWVEELPRWMNPAASLELALARLGVVGHG